MTASAAEGSAKSAELAAIPLVFRTSVVATVGCRAPASSRGTNCRGNASAITWMPRGLRLWAYIRSLMRGEARGLTGGKSQT
jgi:hypothetical protein